MSDDYGKHKDCACAEVGALGELVAWEAGADFSQKGQLVAIVHLLTDIREELRGLRSDVRIIRSRGARELRGELP